tara:strand:+ start:56 stop:655 length:600 start_codon:yes stop_codon:yes gene_type:complete
MIIRLTLALLMLIYLSACAGNPQQQLDAALKLDVDHFKQHLTIEDDEFENIVVFSTHQGLKNTSGTDEFLRGFIDKRTGIKTYQVYVSMKHRSGQWLYPYRASFGRPLITTQTKRIGSDVDCYSRYSSCRYVEIVTFMIPEKEVLRVANNATPADFKTSAWKFKIKTKASEDYLGAILLPEILALIDTMNNYEPIRTRK